MTVRVVLAVRSRESVTVTVNVRWFADPWPHRLSPEKRWGFLLPWLFSSAAATPERPKSGFRAQRNPTLAYPIEMQFFGEKRRFSAAERFFARTASWQRTDVAPHQCADLAQTKPGIERQKLLNGAAAERCSLQPALLAERQHPRRSMRRLGQVIMIVGRFSQQPGDNRFLQQTLDALDRALCKRAYQNSEKLRSRSSLISCR